MVRQVKDAEVTGVTVASPAVPGEPASHPRPSWGCCRLREAFPHTSHQDRLGREISHGLKSRLAHDLNG